MTLWILFCRMTNEVDTLFTFYARDRHHAEMKAEEILDWYGYERLDLTFEPEQGRRFPLFRLAGTLAWWLESPDHAN